MRQLIARIEASLHGRLKERAAAEGRSLNALVTELLERGLDGDDPRLAWKARMRAKGLIWEPPPPKIPPPPLDEIVEAMRPYAKDVIAAFEADRKHR